MTDDILEDKYERFFRYFDIDIKAIEEAATGGSLSDYYTKSQADAITNALDSRVTALETGGGGSGDLTNYYTKGETNALLSGKQSTNAELTAIIGLSPVNNDIIQRKANAWTTRNPSQLKQDLSLDNVNNTSDASKPVSTATQAALDAKQDLDSDLTAIAGLTPTNNDILQRVSGAWTNRTPSQVKSSLALVPSDVGLGNVNNTSDANKPVSTATQTALNAKQDLPAAGDNLDTWLTGFAANAVSGAAYTEPTSQEVTDFLTGLRAIMRGDTSNSLLAALGFTIQVGIEAVTKRQYALVYNEYGTARAWGAYLIDMSNRFTGLLQVPHTVYDEQTEVMGLQEWRDNPGTMLMLNGANRTDATGTNLRDVAHQTGSMFHKVAAKFVPFGMPQLQQHGFADATDSAHDIVVSSGDANQTPAIYRIADALETAGFRVARNWDGTATVLQGTTNVQGDLAVTNGTAFVHIEVNNTTRTTPALLAKYMAALKAANYFATEAMASSLPARGVTGQFPSSIGSANSAGTSPYLALADHVHRLVTNTPANNDTVMRISGAWQSQTVSQAKTIYGLNNVDNTSDANKPISTATQAALDLKAALTVTSALDTRITALESPSIGTLTHGSTVTPDATGARNLKWTMTGDATLAVPTGGFEGERMFIAILASGADRTLTLSGSYKLTTGTSASILIPNTKSQYIGLRYNGTSWAIIASTQEQ